MQNWFSEENDKISPLNDYNDIAHLVAFANISISLGKQPIK